MQGEREILVYTGEYRILQKADRLGMTGRFSMLAYFLSEIPPQDVLTFPLLIKSLRVIKERGIRC